MLMVLLQTGISPPPGFLFLLRTHLTSVARPHRFLGVPETRSVRWNPTCQAAPPGKGSDATHFIGAHGRPLWLLNGGRICIALSFDLVSRVQPGPPVSPGPGARGRRGGFPDARFRAGRLVPTRTAARSAKRSARSRAYWRRSAPRARAMMPLNKTMRVAGTRPAARWMVRLTAGVVTGVPLRCSCVRSRRLAWRPVRRSRSGYRSSVRSSRFRSAGL